MKFSKKASGIPATAWFGRVVEAALLAVVAGLVSALLMACGGGGGGDEGGTAGGASGGSSGSGTGTGGGTASTSTPRSPSPAPTLAPIPASGTVLRVGPTRAVRTLADAARQARDGDVIEVDAATYTGDVSVWTQSGITIRGVGGRPLIDGAGRTAQDKGIFVIAGRDVVLENLELANAKSSALNGAGIRAESKRLTVRNVVFRDNEEGILTNGDPEAELTVRDSQFVGNAFAYSNGYSHAIYVNGLRRLVIEGCWFERTQSGHLIKSRAAANVIRHNRITDGPQGRASYEIDLPNGGESWVVGNLVEQAPGTENPKLVSYGAEGVKWTGSALHLAHNTLVNRRNGSCTWVSAPSGVTVNYVNNLLVGGPCATSLPAGSRIAGNADANDADFVNVAGYDYRLKADSRLRGTAADPGSAGGLALRPEAEFRFPAGTTALAVPASSPGALQSSP